MKYIYTLTKEINLLFHIAHCSLPSLSLLIGKWRGTGTGEKRRQKEYWKRE